VFAVVIGVTAMGCDDSVPDPEQTIVITGLVSHNGKYVLIRVFNTSNVLVASGGAYVSSERADFLLRNYPGLNSNWVGTGNYNLLLNIDGNNDNAITLPDDGSDDEYKYTGGSGGTPVLFTITATETTIPFSKFEP
jgi:hypothetical protein